MEDVKEDRLAIYNATCNSLRQILMMRCIAGNRCITSECFSNDIEILRQVIQDTKKKNDILSGLITRNVKNKELIAPHLTRLKNDYIQLCTDNELSERNLQTDRENNERLEEAAADLQEKLEGLEAEFEEDKRSAVESYQKKLEEEFKSKIDQMKKELRCALSSLDYANFHHAWTLDENDVRERRLKYKYEAQILHKRVELAEEIEKEKTEWECLMRSQMEKERAELEKSLRREIELELQEESHRNKETTVSQAKLACLDEQRLVEEAEIEKALADAKKQREGEHKKDIQQLTRKRKRTCPDC